MASISRHGTQFTVFNFFYVELNLPVWENDKFISDSICLYAHGNLTGLIVYRARGLPRWYVRRAKETLTKADPGGGSTGEKSPPRTQTH